MKLDWDAKVGDKHPSWVVGIVVLIDCNRHVGDLRLSD